MRKLVYLILIVIVVACSTGVSREEQAALAAKGYYTHLVQGEYEQFIEGRLMADSLPADYRSQLIEGYKQFVAQQLEARKGIQEVTVSRAYKQNSQKFLGILKIFLLL